MEELDRSFRPTKGFLICWAIIALALALVARRLRIQMPWYSWASIIVLVSAGGSFLIYGPVLLLASAKKTGIKKLTLLWRVAIPVTTLILVSVGLIFVTDLRSRNEALALGLIALTTTIAVWYVGYSLRTLTKK